MPSGLQLQRDRRLRLQRLYLRAVPRSDAHSDAEPKRRADDQSNGAAKHRTERRANEEPHRGTHRRAIFRFRLLALRGGRMRPDQWNLLLQRRRVLRQAVRLR